MVTIEKKKLSFSFMAVTEEPLINCDVVTYDKHSYNLGDLNTVVFLPFLYLASYSVDAVRILHSAG
jgi:hypothetical protein